MNILKLRNNGKWLAFAIALLLRVVPEVFGKSEEIAPGSGYDYQYRNLGETENKGFEVSLTWNAINTKNYGLTFSGNVGFNKNKVKSLGSLTQYSASSGWASTQIQDDYIVKPGHSVGEIYGYISDGRYEVSDFEHRSYNVHDRIH